MTIVIMGICAAILWGMWKWKKTHKPQHGGKNAKKLRYTSEVIWLKLPKPAFVYLKGVAGLNHMSIHQLISHIVEGYCQANTRTGQKGGGRQQLVEFE